MREGIESGILVLTAGTYASPTTWKELKDVVDDIPTQEQYDDTALKGRHTRSGNRYIRGAYHLMDSIDLKVEWDSTDDACIALQDAMRDKTAVVLAFCPYIPDIVSPATTPSPPDDEEFIKAEFHVFGITGSMNPGNAQDKTIMLRAFKGRKAAVIVPT